MPPSEGPRQRPPEFEQVVASLKSLQQAESKPAKYSYFEKTIAGSAGPRLTNSYLNAINTVRYCLGAQPSNAIREQEYHGWENKDLEDLLTELGE